MRISIIVLGFIVLVAGCKDWEYPQEFPIVFTEEVMNINSEGVELNGNIESLGANQDIINYGFVWSSSEWPTLSSTSATIEESIKKGKFTYVINSDLAADRTYYVRAYVQTDKLVIYGNQVMFISQGSLPPEIEDYSPKSGFDGTEITISGKNFSQSINGNIVKIESINCKVVSVDKNQLKVILPNSPLIGEFKISVAVAGKTVFAQNDFSILGPRIRSISKLSGRVGDLLSIEGEYFDTGSYVDFGFGNEFGGGIHAYTLLPSKMEGYVPDVPNKTDNIHLSTRINSTTKKFVYPEKFTIIDSWELLSNTTPIEPYRVNVRYASAVIGNSIYVNGGKSLYQFNTTNNTWTKKKDFPGEYRFFGTSFTYNNKLYYGFGSGYYPAPSCCDNWQNYNDLWEYDPSTDNWKFLLTAPMQSRTRILSFVIGSKAYLGFGFKSGGNPTSYSDFWSLNLETYTWNSIDVQAPVNSNSVIAATSFAVNGKGYILGLGYVGSSWNKITDMWEFDPSNSTWTKKEDYPDLIYGEAASTINNHGLVISSAVNDSRTRVYEYDPEKDRWIKRQTMMSTTGAFQFAHSVNGALYYASGNLWRLNFD